MGKDEMKAVQEILSSKAKFKRVLVILGIICFTLTVISGLAFYTGAFKWVIK